MTRRQREENRQWYRGLLWAESQCNSGRAKCLNVLLIDRPVPFIEGALDYHAHRTSNPDVFENN